MKMKKGGISLGKLLIHLYFILFSLFILVPFILIVSISFSSDRDMIEYGYRLIPANFTIEAYDIIFRNPGQILNAYQVSILVMGIGTLVGLVVMTMIAYAISRTDFKYRKPISLYIYLTMLFNGGLIPYYILIRSLKLVDTLTVLIIPCMVNAFNIILLRTYFQKIPKEIIESAKIDGSSEFRIYAALILPLSKPAIATISLFVALNYWNEWFNALLFITKRNLQPLQLLLYNMLQNMELITKNMQFLPPGVRVENLPAESVRMAMCIIAAGPMLIIFPFFQRFFVQGLTVGSVKG